MYPLPNPTLTLSEIAQYWARELPGQPPDKEIRDCLVAALWRGDLAIESSAPEKASTDDRRDLLLNIVSRGDDHPGLLFLRPDTEARPEIVDLPDGGSLVDLRHRISWPVAEEAKRPMARLWAFEALAGASLDDYSPNIAPILSTQTVSRNAFARFCEEQGYSLPRFWFAKTLAASSAAAERQCRRWFDRQVANDAKPSSKAAMQAEAQGLFPGLSRNGFVRIWDALAPEAWRQSGRPRTRQG